MGERIVSRLSTLQSRLPDKIGDVRHVGAMLAIELVYNGDVNKPDPELTSAVVAEAARNGLILLPCGIYHNVIRLLPPLTISDELIDEGMDMLSKTLETLIKKKSIQ